MAKSKKKKKNELPSGSYRCQVLDYTDPDGKRHYKSFTAPTKSEAQFLAAQWKTNRAEEDRKAENITLYEAAHRYIESKRAVLSPSTIRGYTGLLNNYFKAFERTKLKDLNNTIIQVWISDIAIDHSPKTVRNAHGLLSSTLEMFLPDFRLKTTLPAKKKPDLYCPSDEDIKKLLDHIRGTEMEIAVLLAAFGPLRRGEICALTSDDVKGNQITVSKSMVQGDDKQWYIKQPKTYGSYRTIDFPPSVIDRIRGINGRLINLNPAQVTNRFGKIILKIGLPHFRFHDLRHYSASIMHAIGVPDQYILKRGGWISDNVMKSVYRNVIDLESVKQNKTINDHFEAMQHDLQHRDRKA